MHSFLVTLHFLSPSTVYHFAFRSRTLPSLSSRMIFQHFPILSGLRRFISFGPRRHRAQPQHFLHQIKFSISVHSPLTFNHVWAVVPSFPRIDMTASSSVSTTPRGAFAAGGACTNVHPSMDRGQESYTTSGCINLSNPTPGETPLEV